MTDGHKNVLLMIADDLGRDYLNCYGCGSIKTPNINALAGQGTRFTNAFASTASCSGSRSTIYTGLHTHQNGQYGLEHSWNHFMTHEHVETVPKIFNALGYQTGIIGKVHVGPRRAYPWEVFDADMTRNVKWVAERAELFFDKANDTGRPFHLTIGFTDPHRDDTREGFANDAKEVLDAGLDREVPDYSAEEVEVQRFMTDVPELRTELVQYYKSISRMDLGLGLVLDALKKRGMDKDTLVIFVSDNGAPFVNSKTTLYDAGVQLPMIMRNPGQNPTVNPNMVSFLDVLPTALAWARHPDNTGAPPSPPRLGNNVLSILEQSDLLPAKEWKGHVFGSHTFHEVQNYWPTRFVRTHRFKYHRNIAHRLDFPFSADLYSSISWEGIRNKDGPGPVLIGQRSLENYLFRGPEELFDLAADADEVRNVAKDASYADVLEWCRDKLERWQYETKDAWLFRDGISATVMEPYTKLGLRIPDRFDIDVEKPSNRAGKEWRPPKAEKRPQPDGPEVVGGGSSLPSSSSTSRRSVVGAKLGWLWKR